MRIKKQLFMEFSTFLFFFKSEVTLLAALQRWQRRISVIAVLQQSTEAKVVKHLFNSEHFE
jgi:hypothetical protein